MSKTVSLTRVESVPDCDRVYHFDELSLAAQTLLSDLVSEGVTAPVDPEAATELAQCAVVKYTDYYQIEYDDSPVSSPVSA